MAEDTVDVAALEQARETLIATVQARIDDNVRGFLLSVEREAPEWERLGLPEQVRDLPAIRWKLLNLGKRTAKKARRRLQQSRRDAGPHRGASKTMTEHRNGGQVHFCCDGKVNLTPLLAGIRRLYQHREGFTIVRVAGPG